VQAERALKAREAEVLCIQRTFRGLRGRQRYRRWKLVRESLVDMSKGLERMRLRRAWRQMLAFCRGETEALHRRGRAALRIQVRLLEKSHKVLMAWVLLVLKPARWREPQWNSRPLSRSAATLKAIVSCFLLVLSVSPVPVVLAWIPPREVSRAVHALQDPPAEPPGAWRRTPLQVRVGLWPTHVAEYRRGLK
jgi:hypothetical protein